MIYVDNRIGSKELYPLFPKHSAELTHLAFGDFSFSGHHKDGEVMIGIERKRIGDLINSMCSGRLGGHQLIGMLNSYHFSYLVIEGQVRANPQSGLMEVYRHGRWGVYAAGRRRFMMRDIWCFLNTIEIVCGVHCYYCPEETDTVQYIMALHHWWDKEYEMHKSHLRPNDENRVQLSKQTVVRRVAGQLEGIGWDRAKAIGERYEYVSELMEATPEELMEIDGIGKVLANSIIEQLRGM